MTLQVIAAYGEGIMYPPNINGNISNIATAGWNRIIFSLFHIDKKGDLYFNDTQIFSGGTYVGDSNWPSQIAELSSTSGSTIESGLASFGGGGVGDFSNVKNIYNSNNKSFSGTNLESNFTAMFKTFSQYIPTIDMDVEQDYDKTSFVAFCQMLIGVGFSLTFCPYTNQGFWVDSLAALNSSNPGNVLWWNLQCYDGGAGNDPADWAQAITAKIKGFDTTGFILPGDWAQSKKGGGDDPAAVKQLISTFASEASYSARSSGRLIRSSTIPTTP